MGFRYTPATRAIVNFIDEYGFITVNFCADIFYKDKKSPIHQARVKLNNLYNNKALTRYKSESGEYIYQLNKAVVGAHRYNIIKLYSFLYKNYEVLYFKPEQVWSTCKRRSDAHIVIKIGESRIGLLVEYEKFHSTNKDKLKDIYQSGEVQEWYRDNFKVDYYPVNLLITATGSSKLCRIENDYITICTNYKLETLIDELEELV